MKNFKIAFDPDKEKVFVESNGLEWSDYLTHLLCWQHSPGRKLINRRGLWIQQSCWQHREAMGAST